MKYTLFFLLLMGVVMFGFSKDKKETFHKTVDYVNMNSFLGDWYVIALMPTPFEKGVTHGIENYSLDKNGNIKVEYKYKKDGKSKVMHQKGWIIDTKTNAHWEVQPLWPFKLPYYVLDIDSEYTYTVIGTDNFNYLWIMSRTPQIDPNLLEQIIKRLEDRGYDRSKLEYVPQYGEDNE